MKSYTFQTIVATATVRADFTAKRDELSSSDKELMTAMFNLATADPDALKAEVERLQTLVALEKSAKKAEKDALKASADEAAKAARAAVVKAAVLGTTEEAPEPATEEAPAPMGIAAKAPKKGKKSKQAEPAATDTSDDIEVLIVDGTGN